MRLFREETNDIFTYSPGCPIPMPHPTLPYHPSARSSGEQPCRMRMMMKDSCIASRSSEMDERDDREVYWDIRVKIEYGVKCRA